MNTPDQSPIVGGSRTVRFRRWLFSRRTLRRLLILLAWLVTLIALFHGEETWRGKRAWEKCRRELEAKGEVLDWNAFIPAPVPDEQNIFKVPKMTEWFVKGCNVRVGSGKPFNSHKTEEPFSLAPGWDAKRSSVLLAEVKVVPSDGPPSPGKADAVWRFDDPAAPEQAAKLLRERIGPCAESAQNCLIVARPLDQTNPVHLVLQADTVPTLKALTEFFPRRPVPQHSVLGASDSGCFQLAPAGSNVFRLSLKAPVYAATDYLALSQPAVPDFDLIRQALEHPCARMDGDWQRPFEGPIPNFVRLRTVAQVLSQRAQCYLLLGQPEAAWRELALVRDICRISEGEPPGKPTTLVAAMIDVAITGLYTSIIEDGLRLKVWREPELIAMQNRLKDINLVPLVRESLSAERAAVCYTFETTPPGGLHKLFSSSNAPRLWARLKDPVYLFDRLAPRGWVYQNMCAVALLDQELLQPLDVSNDQVLPSKTDGTDKEILTAKMARSPFTPYTFLAAIALPNVTRSWQTAAHNQTLVNQAYLACVLERYQLAHGQYPETLEALVPQFAEKLPHDLIGGQPLKYHRTEDGRFVLYSVGWNEKDDGGVPGKSLTDGDWVWAYPAN
jgi:hypothetical protein